jgi:large subunit ribosomal protein L13
LYWLLFLTYVLGKHKPTFCPNYDCGDYVVVINAKFVKLSGTKLEDKRYRWHTGYPGGLKEMSPKVLLERKPEEVCAHKIIFTPENFPFCRC